MARSFGRLFASIWNDDDFRPLSVGAKVMYGFLISQTDLEHSGIIPLRPPRWARDLGEPVEDVTAWLKELDQAKFTVTDEEAGELLVRSLIRRDDIWKQPNVFKAAATSARTSKSPQIKGTLYHEIYRLDLARTNRETQAIRDDLLTLLEPFGNPSPNPPEGFPRGGRGDNGGLTEGSYGPSGNSAGRAVGRPSVDKSARSDETAGRNPSGTLSEPQANPSAGPQGKGSSYGPVVEVPLPHSPTPSPVASPEPMCPPRLFALPDVQPEEGDQAGEQTQGQLAAAVRRLRPAWSTKSIERALADPSVVERPWPMVCAAMLAVARDPESKHPGRLAHDGPWWAEAARTQRASLPPVDRHAYEPGANDAECASCGLPASNRRHLEAS